MGGFFTHEIGIFLFKKFIKTVLSGTCLSKTELTLKGGTLERVSDKSWSPSGEVSSQSFSTIDF
jgi:hypothetical protein